MARNVAARKRSKTGPVTTGLIRLRSLSFRNGKLERRPALTSDTTVGIDVTKRREYPLRRHPWPDANCLPHRIRIVRSFIISTNTQIVFRTEIEMMSFGRNIENIMDASTLWVLWRAGKEVGYHFANRWSSFSAEGGASPKRGLVRDRPMRWAVVGKRTLATTCLRLEACCCFCFRRAGSTLRFDQNDTGREMLQIEYFPRIGGAFWSLQWKPQMPRRRHS